MTLQEKYKDYKIILASKSPRRHDLFKGLGLDFEIIVNDIEETYPAHLTDVEIALYLAELKASSWWSSQNQNTSSILKSNNLLSVSRILIIFEIHLLILE